MLPENEYKKILEKMEECMTIPPGLFNRLIKFKCRISERFNNDWREVSEIRSISEQFEVLEYPAG